MRRLALRSAALPYRCLLPVTHVFVKPRHCGTAGAMATEDDGTTDGTPSRTTVHTIGLDDDGRLPHDCAQEISTVFADSVPTPSGQELAKLVEETKNARELARIYSELVMRHPLVHDPLNGHGFRVNLFNKITIVSARIGDIDTWHAYTTHVRALGFHMSR